ncbi:MAG: phosphate acetyltransferase [Gemmatimonadota bacterium]|nr:phosphate acetyltransferase [Gemmatimonadota bacterium]
MGDIIGRFKQMAVKEQKKVVLPESTEERMLKATEIIMAEGIAKVVLLGDEDEIRAAASAASADLSGAEIIPLSGTPQAGELAGKLYELRKHKGMTEEQAAETLKTPMYYAAMLVREGLADGYVAGALNTTGNTLKPALQIIKTRPGIRTVSSYFLMVLPDTSWGVEGTLFFADCAICPDPNEKQLAEIAITTADSFKTMMGTDPLVAMLSFSTKGSAKHSRVNKVAGATEIIRKERPDIQVDGELQADAALIEKVGAKKSPGSAVAGKANVLIFPDLDSGNIAYKLVQRLAGAEAIGPVIQGIARPVNDLSRGCSVEDIVSVTAITAIS